ncbi:MAG: hypothetical protein CM1200mP34_5030 [Verrucomicrobiales bacterium]|nr:MAG: hypothetical protein CM1200mP34_5030 [Verrucomicrobiales bacterium]
MKQAAKMQRQMQEAQEQLADQLVEASSGGGRSRSPPAAMGGQVDQDRPRGCRYGRIRCWRTWSWRRQPGARKGRETQAAEMGKLTGGMGGGMGLPGL